MAQFPPYWLTRSRLSARQLALLLHLGEKRSVLHAAEAVHLTQPAASKALAQLEEALGVRLFVRHARGVEPTVYGEILVRHARNVLAELRQTHEELEAARTGLSGDVRLGTAITSATTLVPEAVIALNRRSPCVRVSIELGFSEALVRKLLDREFDIVIARLHHSQDAHELMFEPIVDRRHDIVARAGHPLTRQSCLTLADLANQTWVLPPAGNVMRDRLDTVFLQAGLDLPQRVVETPSLPIIVELLRDSDMLAPLATDVMRPYYDAGVLAPVSVELDLRLGLEGLITLRGQRLAPAPAALLVELREAVAASRCAAV